MQQFLEWLDQLYRWSVTVWTVSACISVVGFTILYILSGGRIEDERLTKGMGTMLLVSGVLMGIMLLSPAG